MSKVVTFGEIMLRLSTERHLRFSQSKSFALTFGGGEFNVAVSLANFGVPAQVVTCLPQNEIGETALMEIRKRNVSSANVQMVKNSRIGIYFLETGAGTRSSNVLYDRAHSAMANVTSGTFNWREILKDAKWFHWSGITPAISDNAAKECLEAVKVASELGITISTDLNYRSKLWKYGKEPHEVMPELLQYSNIILGDIDTAYFMLGENQINPNYQNLNLLPSLYDKVFKMCPNLKTMATTLRYSVSASHQRIGGILYDGKSIYDADIKEVTPVVDRVGSGDAFMAGLIYGLLSDDIGYQKSINMAVASCCLKHTIYGDYNLVSLKDIERFINSDSHGKVSR